MKKQSKCSECGKNPTSHFNTLCTDCYHEMFEDMPPRPPNTDSKEE